ncbi:MAG: hypothetical protein OXI43_14480 [Candidatus Poribacteria bacterium]|nr:hypothetical protein [Candidatus Poribacteria bacterium]
MGNPVVSFDIVGKDSKTLGDFYRSVFDWKWTQYAEGYYGFETGSESDNGIKEDLCIRQTMKYRS